MHVPVKLESATDEQDKQTTTAKYTNGSLSKFVATNKCYWTCEQ